MVVGKSLSHVGWNCNVSFTVTFVPQKNSWDVIVQVVLVTFFYPRWQRLAQESTDNDTFIQGIGTLSPAS